MPNWCENELYIEGPVEDVTTVHAMILTPDEGGFFGKLIPYPARFKEMDAASEKVRKLAEDGKVAWGSVPKDGFNSGGYEWCCENWGTKWWVGNEQIKQKADSPRRKSYRFSTAWSPPIPVMKALAAKFPSLSIKLKYFEGGMQFKGELHYKNGEETFAEEKKYYGRRGG